MHARGVRHASHSCWDGNDPVLKHKDRLLDRPRLSKVGLGAVQGWPRGSPRVSKVGCMHGKVGGCHSTVD